LLLLPDDAAALATGAWQSATQLTVAVEDEHGSVRGVIPLEGLGRALILLRSNCAVQWPRIIIMIDWNCWGSRVVSYIYILKSSPVTGGHVIWKLTGEVWT
jgi:hypothetical protein